MIEGGRLSSDPGAVRERDCPHDEDINNEIRSFILQKIIRASPLFSRWFDMTM